MTVRVAGLDGAEPRLGSRGDGHRRGRGRRRVRAQREQDVDIECPRRVRVLSRTDR